MSWTVTGAAEAENPKASIVKLAKAPKEVTRGIYITTPLHLHSATVVLNTLCLIRSIAYNVFFIQPAPLVWFGVRTLFALDPVPSPFPLPMVNNDEHRRDVETLD